MVENQDETPKIPEPTQKVLVENVPLKMTAKMSPSLCPKCKYSPESLKTLRVTDEVPQSIVEVSEKQGPSNISPEFKKERRIFVSGTEISLLEIDVDYPGFWGISNEANIPKQRRLGILSPKSKSEENSRQFAHTRFKKAFKFQAHQFQR